MSRFKSGYFGLIVSDTLDLTWMAVLEVRLIVNVYWKWLKFLTDIPGISPKR